MTENLKDLLKKTLQETQGHITTLKVYTFKHSKYDSFSEAAKIKLEAKREEYLKKSLFELENLTNLTGCLVDSILEQERSK